MKPLLTIMLTGLLFGGTALGSELPAQGHGQKPSKHQRAGDNTVEVYFSTGEISLIRGYYVPRYRGLPRGLQKKLYRTGQLPPGWARKLEPFPRVVERQLMVLPSGYRRGVIDGHAVIFDPRTQVIIDVALLF